MRTDANTINPTNAPAGQRLLLERDSLACHYDPTEVWIVEWSPAGYCKVEYASGATDWWGAHKQGQYIIADKLPYKPKPSDIHQPYAPFPPRPMDPNQIIGPGLLSPQPCDLPFFTSGGTPTATPPVG